MSTKPPTAVMMPSVSSSGFKRGLDLLELRGIGAQGFGRRIVRFAGQRAYEPAVVGLRLRKSRLSTAELLSQPVVHARSVGRGELSLPRLLIDERPFGRDGAGLLNILKISLRSLGTGRKQQ